MNAEYLPDNINMMNEDGDIVPVDHEPEAPEIDADPPEAYRSPNYYVVEDIIKSGIEHSRAGGYAAIKVRPAERLKPLGQFLAIDLYKYGLGTDEIQDMLDRYLPRSGESDPAKRSVRRELGHYATSGAGELRDFDFRERASGLHKEFDD